MFSFSCRWWLSITHLCHTGKSEGEGFLKCNSIKQCVHEIAWLEPDIRAKAPSPVAKNCAVISYKEARTGPRVTLDERMSFMFKIAGNFARRYYGFGGHTFINNYRNGFKRDSVERAKCRHKDNRYDK